MVQPINYMAMIPQPNIGAKAANLANTLQQRQALQAQQQAAQQQAAQRQQYATDVQEAFRAGTPQAFSALSAKYPEQGKALRESWNMLDTANQDAEFRENFELYTAMNTAPEIAETAIDERIQAALNSGEDPRQFQAIKELYKTDPDRAKSQLAFTMSAVDPDRWSKMNDERRSRSTEKVEKELKEVDVAKKLKEIDKLDVETKQQLLELEKIKQRGDAPPPEQTFKMENDLRKDYNKATEGLTESQRNLEVIEQSAADQSGAGDTALITSFMKMLDPGSVVRETEFAQARDTAGLYESLKNSLKKAQTGKFLSPSQRKTFVNLSKKYLQAAERGAKRTRDDMGVMIDRYQLDRDAIFGTDSGRDVVEAETVEIEDEPAQPTSPTRPRTRGQRGLSPDATDDEILQFYLNTGGG